jgi:hypothetical protein
MPGHLNGPTRHLSAAAALLLGVAILTAGTAAGASARTPRTAIVRAAGAPRHRGRPRKRRPAPRPTPRPLLFGFNTYTTTTTIAKQAELGARTTRMFVDWEQLEPVPGVFEWSAFDAQYKALLAAGIRPLIVADTAPCWAEKATGCNPAYTSPPAPAFDSAWQTYVRDLAVRYPRAVGIEVWNEPNLASQWYPKPDPQRYTQLLEEAYTTVKAAAPALPVISGGIAMGDGSGFAAGGEGSPTFLAALLADGARRWMDALAIHVYPTDTLAGGRTAWDPAAMSRWLAQVKNAAAAAKLTEPPIWVTEMGVSTTTQPGFPPAVSAAQQSADLSAMVGLARADSHVRTVIVDSLQDADPDLATDLLGDVLGSVVGDDVFYGQIAEGLGVFTITWRPKPAACTLSVLFKGSLRC